MAALRSWTVPWGCCWWQQSDYILISLTYKFCSSHFCGQRRSWDWQQAQVVLPRLFLGQRHLFDWEIWWLMCVDTDMRRWLAPSNTKCGSSAVQNKRASITKKHLKGGGENKRVEPFFHPSIQPSIHPCPFILSEDGMTYLERRQLHAPPPSPPPPTALKGTFWFPGCRWAFMATWQMSIKGKP